MKSDDWQIKNQLLLIAPRYICMSKHGNLHCRSVFSNTFLKDIARVEEVLAGQRTSWSFISKNGLTLISNIHWISLHELSFF